MEHFDWYAYGGISRGVELHRLGPGPRRRRQDRHGLGRRAAHRSPHRLHRRQPGPAALAIECDGRALLAETVDLEPPAPSTGPSRSLGPHRGRPADPRLSLLAVNLGDDDLRERFGLREVATANGRITVNGEPVRLLGVNRHEAHPQFGHTQPATLLVNDVQQLRDLGANFVRGSHYPLDPLFLDLCDEAGILVWCESIGWQYPVEHLTDPSFVEAQLAHIDEMVAAARNHPSIILWGILNECPSWSEAGRPVYAALLGRLRELDPTRPVTYASVNAHDDLCFDLVDVVSANTYPGWYFGDVPDIPAELDRIGAHVDALGHADKPLIISEIGAGAVPGHDRSAHCGPRTTRPNSSPPSSTTSRRPGPDLRSAIWVLGDFRTTEQRESCSGGRAV